MQGIICSHFFDSSSNSSSSSSDSDSFIETETVTVVQFKTKATDGTEFNLYHLVAGSLLNHVNVSKETNEVTQQQIVDEKLFNTIKKLSNEDLSDNLSEEKKEKLLQHSPHFIVTSKFPTTNDDAQTIADLRITPKVMEHERVRELIPEDQHSTKLGESYIYFHPEKKDMFIRVREPASPAGRDFVVGDGSIVSSNMDYQVHSS